MRRWMMMLVALVACAGSDDGETAPTSGTCSCEGVALLELTLLDSSGGPIVPEQVTVSMDGAAYTEAPCVENVCEWMLPSWPSDGSIVFDVSITSEGGDLADVVEVDASEIDAQSGCDCQNWVGAFDLVF